MAGYNCYCLNKKGLPMFDGMGKPDLKNGDLYISVSQILSQENAGDFLIPWALRTFGHDSNPLSAYRDYMTKVSDLGSRLHHFIECDLEGTKYPNEVQEDMMPGIESYYQWRNSHHIELVDTEKILYSKKLQCAGTRDLKVKIDGVLYMADWKTGSVYDKAFTQLVAYKYMAKEMGEKNSEEAKLLVLGGADSKSKLVDGGPILMHTLDSFFPKVKITEEDLFAKFMCLRYIWFSNNLKSRKFQPVIKGMEEYLSPMVERFKKAFDVKGE